MAENSKKQKRRGPGRQFQKGQSGNPGGRPKEYAGFKDWASQQTSADWFREEALWMAKQRGNVRGKGFAMRFLAEYGLGKPEQSIQGNVSVTHQIVAVGGDQDAYITALTQVREWQSKQPQH